MRPYPHCYYLLTLFKTPHCSQGLVCGSGTAGASPCKLSTRRNSYNLHMVPEDVKSSSADDDSQLLRQWAAHSSLDFHRFSDEEAVAIRHSLLNWYTQNRRKLPWRGDDPPWQGSTAKEKTRAQKHSTTSQRRQQTKLKGFFAPKHSTSSKLKSEESQQEEALPLDSAFPISGYGVWVSEIMLQQTRVEAVIPYWIKWMKRFPTVQDLAKADEDTVNAHWAGLGFYRRARLLHQASKIVAEDYQGELPQTVDGLLKLPGIGRYTASAVASVAFDVTVPVVDGNVCRVLCRLKGISQHIKAPVLKDNCGWDLAAQIVEAGDGSSPGLVNQALMELGATYCAPSGTGIDPLDPLRDYYMSTRIGHAASHVHDRQESASIFELITNNVDSKGTTKLCPVCAEHGVRDTLSTLIANLELAREKNPNENAGLVAKKTGHGVFPMPPPKTAKREEVLAVAVLTMKVEGELAWLLVKRDKTGLLAGQWEFPSVRLWNSDEAAKTKGKRKDMSDKVPIVPPAKRRKALDLFLAEIWTNSGNSGAPGKTARVQIADTLEHVFSHIRHTMWIETACVQSDATPGMDFELDTREARWMTAKKMKQVGVTSGVNKILKATSNSKQAAVSSRKRSKRQ